MMHFVCYVSTEASGYGSRIPADTQPLTDPVSATRVLCGALILPTIATIVGKLMFGNINSNFQRTLLVSDTRNLSARSHL